MGLGVDMHSKTYGGVDSSRARGRKCSQVVQEWHSS